MRNLEVQKFHLKLGRSQIQSIRLYGARNIYAYDLQTTQNTQDLLDLRKSLSAVDDKVASIIDTLGNVVTKSELANVMLDFSNPTVRRGWLILNGQPVESD